MQKLSMKILSIFVLIFFTFNTATAGWLNDWYNNISVNKPGVFQLQDRGLLVGGSFTSKTKLKTDNLFSIQPPRIKVGCGGIDIFLGSFSFLNPEYLIEKAKRIIQAAPYFAFDLALSVLCHECAAAMKWIQSIIDKLNALQLDECKASKALVAMGAEALFNGTNVLNDAGQRVSSGFNSLFKDAGTAASNEAGSSISQRIKSYYDNAMSDFFGGHSAGSGKSRIVGVLANCLNGGEEVKCSVVDAYYQAHSNAANVMSKDELRWFVGDIVISKTKQNITVVHRASTIPSSIDNFALGTCTFSNGDLNCQKTNDQPLSNRVSNALGNLASFYTFYKNGNSTLDSNTKKVIELTSVPVAAFMRMALLRQIYTRGSGGLQLDLESIANNLEEYVTFEIAHKLVVNAQQIGWNMIGEMTNAAISSLTGLQDAEGILNQWNAAKEDMRTNLDQITKTLLADIQAKMQSKQQNYLMVYEQYKKDYELIPVLLSSVFGKSLLITGKT